MGKTGEVRVVHTQRRVYPNKVKAVVDCLMPKENRAGRPSVPRIRKILRKFMQGYSRIAALLVLLTKQTTPCE